MDPNEQQPILAPTLTYVRRIYAIGRSYALALPPAWVRRNNVSAIRLATVTTLDDGSLIVRPIVRPAPVAGIFTDSATIYPRPGPYQRTPDPG